MEGRTAVSRFAKAASGSRRWAARSIAWRCTRSRTSTLALLFRSLLATGVRYDEALDIHDDWDFVLQLSEHTRFAFVDQLTFRWHSDIGTSGGGGVGNFDPAKFETQRNYVREKWARVVQAHVERFNGLWSGMGAGAARGAG